MSSSVSAAINIPSRSSQGSFSTKGSSHPHNSSSQYSSHFSAPHPHPQIAIPFTHSYDKNNSSNHLADYYAHLHEQAITNNSSSNHCYGSTSSNSAHSYSHSVPTHSPTFHSQHSLRSLESPQNRTNHSHLGPHNAAQHGFNRLHQSSLPLCHALTQSPQQQGKNWHRRASQMHGHHNHSGHRGNAQQNSERNNKAGRAPYNSNVFILSSSYDSSHNSQLSDLNNFQTANTNSSKSNNNNDNHSNNPISGSTDDEGFPDWTNEYGSMTDEANLNPGLLRSSTDNSNFGKVQPNRSQSPEFISLSPLHLS
jgi:hypothetical protein